MDILNDDSSHDRLIEDYLFSGYQSSSYKLSSDIDQQFARPIEDEDIFGIDKNINPTDPGLGSDQYQELGRQLDGQDSFCDAIDLDFGGSNLHNAGKDLFSEDYKEADLPLLPDLSSEKPTNHINIEFSGIANGANPERSDPEHRKISAPALGCQSEAEDKDVIEQVDRQSKKLETLQKLREQVLARGMTPKKPEATGGLVELDVNLKASELPSRGRVIYEKMLRKSRESKRGLYGGRKITWPLYSEVLRKKISADKRKIWDSFQKPTDNFDDEEEVIMSEAEPEDDSPVGSPTPNQSSPTDKCSPVSEASDSDCEVEYEVGDDAADAESKESDAEEDDRSPVTTIKGPVIQEDESDY